MATTLKQYATGANEDPGPHDRRQTAAHRRRVILHSIIVALLLLTIACAVGWYTIYRRLDQKDRAAHPRYRTYQVLTASIAALVILLALLIVFSSDPGNPDDYLYWP